jgi:hypothetical protein
MRGENELGAVKGSRERSRTSCSVMRTGGSSLDVGREGPEQFSESAVDQR